MKKHKDKNEIQSYAFSTRFTPIEARMISELTKKLKTTKNSLLRLALAELYAKEKKRK